MCSQLTLMSSTYHEDQSEAYSNICHYYDLKEQRLQLPSREGLNAQDVPAYRFSLQKQRRHYDDIRKQHISLAHGFVNMSRLLDVLSGMLRALPPSTPMSTSRYPMPTAAQAQTGAQSPHGGVGQP